MQKPYFKILTILTVLFSITMYGQQDYMKKIQNYLEKNQSTYRLDSKDYSNLTIYDQYYTKALEVEHVYAIQKINDIPVFNGIGNFAFKNNEIIYFANSFQSHIQKRVNVATPTLTPAQAVAKAAQQLGLEIAETPEIISAKSNQEFLLSKAGISLTEIPAKLVYQPTSKETLRLAWDISIQTLDGKHWWSVRVDALSGEIIDKGDWIVHCSFSENQHFESAVKTISSTQVQETFGRATASFLGDGSQYKVFPLPIESPDHGSRTIVSEPANAIASPQGWHDTNGLPGIEYTTTRGNNVWAFENRDGDNTPGTSPNGTSALEFVFPLNLNQDPSGYLDAAITNLFYMNNKLHDIWYQYGFDEASGNFQSYNLGNGGEGNDYVLALAQAGSDNGPGNNANFATPPDGASGVMRMFTWSASGQAQVLTITAPSALAGNYSGNIAGFGPAIPAAGITADFVLVEDDNSGTSTDTYDGCDVITNGADISGKIAVIRRGDCSFETKVLNAQSEGAIAVIIVNNEPGLITMSGSDPAVSIPSILITMTDGEAIITSLLDGNVITGTIIQTGPFEKDGDLDNGIIAHEFGHGISNRLTGGPSQAYCLQNAEQMGEGWSDFFGLVLTMEPGDQAEDARGYGTYVQGQPISGPGFRQFKYSTDMSINPFTYNYVQYQHFPDGEGGQTIHVHGVGAIWATMLWDMTWALIEEYGFDPDVYNGTGGNNIAMQLVIDGLKLQPCSPGFIDGRDAILAADEANNGGANKCLIWTVFANRGLGYSATQGESNSIADQTAAFDLPPDCLAGTTGFEGSSFQIYPNPTHGIVNISSSKINGEVYISLFDINGRKVLNKKVDMSGQATINVSNLSTGIYVMQLISDGKTQTEKLIVQ